MSSEGARAPGSCSSSPRRRAPGRPPSRTASARAIRTRSSPFCDDARAARRRARRDRLPLRHARALRGARRRRAPSRSGRRCTASATGRCAPPSRRRSPQGRIAVFDIDVQGGAQIQAAWPRETVAVFVLPPSMAELERRLRGALDGHDEVHRAAARGRARGGGARLAATTTCVVNDELERGARRRHDAIAAHERGPPGRRPIPPAAGRAEACLLAARAGRRAW